MLAIVGFVLLTGRLFGSVFGLQSGGLFLVPLLGLLPMVLVDVLFFLFRFTRLWLQTTGGPVILASKISFSDPRETEVRYNMIKQAIEKAISLRQKR